MSFPKAKLAGYGLWNCCNRGVDNFNIKLYINRRKFQINKLFSIEKFEMNATKLGDNSGSFLEVNFYKISFTQYIYYILYSRSMYIGKKSIKFYL